MSRVVKAVEGFWRRWKLTAAYVLIFLAFAFAWWLDDGNDRQLIDAIATSSCDDVTRVRDAALGLTTPVTTVAPVDAETAGRIAIANAQRANVAEQLREDLACTTNGDEPVRSP